MMTLYILFLFYTVELPFPTDALIIVLLSYDSETRKVTADVEET